MTSSPTKLIHMEDIGLTVSLQKDVTMNISETQEPTPEGSQELLSVHL